MYGTNVACIGNLKNLGEVLENDSRYLFLIFPLGDEEGIYSENEKQLIQSLFGDKVSYSRQILVKEHGSYKEILVNIKKEKDIETIVSEVLGDLGIPYHIKGYEYLTYIFKSFIIDKKKKTEWDKLSKGLYPDVAKQFKVPKPSRIERALRHAIEVGTKRGNLEFWNEIFNKNIDPKEDKPTNSQFLSGVLKYIELNYL